MASFSLPNLSHTFTPTPNTSSNLRRSFRISASCATAERSSSSTVSFYDVLGVQTCASYQEIKTAYRKLARVLHPDVATSDDDEFVRVNAAYDTLSDPDKRKVYDGSIMRRRLNVASLNVTNCYSDVSRRRRTWETDQCW